MSDIQQKKKHGEPILLFPKNQALIDGRSLDAINQKDVMDIFAKRKHFSTMHEKETREVMGCIVVFGIGLFLLSVVGIGILGSNQNYYPVLILFLVLIPSTFIIYRSVLSINYRPAKVKQIYQTWLKRGVVIEGQIVSISSYRNTATIGYQFTDDNGEEIRGRYLTHHMVIPRSVHQDKFEKLKNKTIYILYADKKLHAPL